MVDIKNIIRIDIDEIFNAIKRKSFYIVRALAAQNGKGENFHPDDYAISDNELQEVCDSLMEGASQISNYASMVKNHTQSGIDALTFYQDLETPLDADSFVDPDTEVDYDEYITGPDGNTVLVTDIIGKEHETGEKLSKGIGDTVLFSVEGLEDDQNRYTVVQQFIREALIAFVLYKWFTLMGVSSQASIHSSEFDKMVQKVRFNAVNTHQRKNRVRNTRPLGF